MHLSKNKNRNPVHGNKASTSFQEPAFKSMSHTSASTTTKVPSTTPMVTFSAELYRIRKEHSHSCHHSFTAPLALPKKSSPPSTACSHAPTMVPLCTYIPKYISRPFFSTLTPGNMIHFRQLAVTQVNGTQSSSS